MFIAIWTVAVTILAKNFRNPFARWIGLTFFVGGCASFAFSIHSPIVPFLDRQGALSPSLLRTLDLVSLPAFWLYWNGLGYCLLVSALAFSEALSVRRTSVVACLLAVPAIVNFAVHADFSIPFQLNIADFRLLNGAYIAASLILFFGTTLKEKDSRKRKNRLRTSFVLSTAVSFVYINDYIGIDRVTFGNRQFTVDSNGLWEYNYLIIFWVVGFFLYYGLKYGFLGIKLRVEEQKFEDSMRNLTHGTQILNHAIKNEISKIHYLSGRASSFLKDGRSDKVELSLTGIGQVANHLLDMIDRIRGKAGDVELKESKEDVCDLIDSVLDAVRPLHPGEVRITKDYRANGTLLCDKTHVREMLSNLLLNAFDALPKQGGRLHIETGLAKRKLTVTITDNGCGISKENLSRVFAPFFSTKKDAQSYGLGLSYCYSVMNKHGGKIAVEWSEPGQGTAMQLEFPDVRFEPATGSASVPFVVH